MRADHIRLRDASALSGLSPKFVLELCLVGIIRARVAWGQWRVHREFAVWRGL